MISDKEPRQRVRRKIRPGHVIAALAACGALALPPAVATQAQAQVSAAGTPCTTDCHQAQVDGVWLAAID
jgi:hypothetical protein